MGIFEIVCISVGLAMDAFAVSICKGLSMKKIDLKKSRIIATYFGSFQAIMPIIGYFLGNSFASFIIEIDHWIIVFLLSLIGGKMIKDALAEKIVKKDDKTDFKSMITLAIATSIDALAIGITLSFLDTNIILASLSIGTITFILSFFGVIFGNKFGYKYEDKAEIFGGIILIFIGLKILLEHLGAI